MRAVVTCRGGAAWAGRDGSGGRARRKKNNGPPLPLFLPPPSAAFDALKAAYHPEVASDAASTVEEHKGKMSSMTVVQLEELKKYEVPGASKTLYAKLEKQKNYAANRLTNAGYERGGGLG